jgi:hypothetical protein
MCAAGLPEMIDDGELLYRRIPESTGWYDPTVDPRPSPRAFNPREGDKTGLSLSRAKYKTLEEVAKGQPGKRYYVAVLKAGDLRATGIELVQTPPEDPSHCEIGNLTYANRKENASQEIQKRLAHELCLRIEGPF